MTHNIRERIEEKLAGKVVICDGLYTSKVGTILGTGSSRHSIKLLVDGLERYEPDYALLHVTEDNEQAIILLLSHHQELQKTREGVEDWKEEFWYKVAEWNNAQPEDIDIYANQLEMLIEYHMKERVHQELQKARQTWLREEIVKLEGRLIPVPKMELSPYTTDYQIMMDSGFRLSDAKLYNQAIQTIIDRYQSELGQDKK